MRWMLLAAALLLWTGCSTSTSDEPAASDAAEETASFFNVHADVDFVGDATCAQCHEDIVDSYQDHGMANSYYPLTPESAVEDFDSEVVLEHEASGFFYRMYREGDRFFQEEYRLDAEGEKTHRLVREMEFVVGSGTAARTYFTEEKGRYYELPVTWYTQKEAWGFSPGYDVANQRFDREIPDRCMACHNSLPETVPFVPGKYVEVPNGIGCERCHGPGELHADERLISEEAPYDIDSTIVNPAHLELDRSLDVCQQCHVNTSVSILREGRGAFSFRPSEDLADHLALFSAEKKGAEDAIDVISHADRMKQSECFIGTLEADDPMTCTTCHDPHEGFRTSGPDYFNATCRDCHAVEPLQERMPTPDLASDHGADANCFSCHMPKVEADDAPHASFTDHMIRVVEQVGEASLPPEVVRTGGGPRARLIPYFDRDEEGREASIYHGMALVIYGRQEGDLDAAREGVTMLAEALADDTTHGEAHHLHGLGLRMLGRDADAVPALERSVRIDPGIPERLNNLAQVYEAQGTAPTTIDRLYRRAISIQPEAADIRLNYGRFLEQQQRLQDAQAQYEAAVASDSWNAVAHYNLGTLLLRRGQSEAAVHTLREALELDPDHLRTLGNLGMHYAQAGRTDSARVLFEHAVDVDGKNPVALANLGSFELNEGNFARAVDLLTRAVEERPAFVNGLANLSLAHFRMGSRAQARRYAERTLRLAPQNPIAQQILQAL